jgi:ATP-dependent protease ClpP protease subunit
MAKELYLYNPIYSYTAEDLMTSMEEFKDEDITLRMNTPGGSVFDGYGMLSKMKEHGNVTIMLDGMAASMGAFMLPFAKRVIAYDLAKVMIHRADAYTGGDETRINNLKDINKTLRAKFEKRVNAEKFLEVTGKTLDDVFNGLERVDIWLTAKEAKKIGLIDEVRVMTPEIQGQIAASMGGSQEIIVQKVLPIINKNMTKEEFKAKHPEAYASIVGEAQENEQDRIEAWMSFIDTDKVAVEAGIASGKAPSLKEITTLTKKAIAIAAVATLEKGNPKDVGNADSTDVGASDEKLTASEIEFNALEAELKGLIQPEKI